MEWRTCTRAGESARGRTLWAAGVACAAIVLSACQGSSGRVTGPDTSETAKAPEASGSTVTAAATCTASNLSLTMQRPDASHLRAVGSYQGCSGGPDTTMFLQRSRWWGWEDMASVTIHPAGTSASVVYDCRGTGTHDYRATASGRVSNRINGVTCPN